MVNRFADVDTGLAAYGVAAGQSLIQFFGGVVSDPV
jgi:hypothetical protein